MKARRVGSRWLVKGEPGDRLPDALATLAREQSWKSGSVIGLGGVQNVRLAYFDLQQKQYLPIETSGVLELISLTGNLSIANHEPLWHMHAAVSDREGHVTAGHLVSLEVAITLECWLDVTSESIYRRRGEETGLNLLDL